MEKELKTLLRKLAAEYETKDFINDDPVRFVHAYADKQDMEIVGFIASWLAYGNRKVIVSTRHSRRSYGSSIGSYYRKRQQHESSVPIDARMPSGVP